MSKPLPKASWLNTTARLLWQLTALWIIVLATLVVLGRQAIVNLAQYQHQIQDQISEQIGAPVRFSHIEGEWTGMSPSFLLRDLAILDTTNTSEQVISVARVEAQPDLLASIYHRRLVLQRLVVANMHLSLTEDANGFWSVGLPMSESSGTGFELLETLLFKSRLIRVESVELEVNFHSGASAPVELRKVNIENSENFHRLVASLSVSNAAESARLEMEGWGNPLLLGEFQGTYYLKVNEINNIGLIRAALERWLPKQFRDSSQVHSQVNGEVWLNLDGKGLGKIGGYLDAAEIPFNWNSEIPPVRDFHTDLSGHYSSGQSWSMTAQQLVFSWENKPVTPTAISYTQQVGDSWGEGQLTVSRVDLAILKSFLEQAGGLPEPALDAISELNPSGLVAPLRVKVAVTPEKQLQISALGNLQDVAIDSFAKGPASRQINGYFEVWARGSEDLGGFVEIDSPQGLSMWYPTAYDDYMIHGSVKGRVDWRLDRANHRVQVNSGPLEISGEEGQGSVFVNLSLPLKREYGAPHMTLQVGMHNSHSRYRNQYIPNVLNPALKKWLDEAIGEANVPEAGFIWRGSLLASEAEQRSIQLYLRTSEGQLQFQPDWPAIENMTALLIVDDVAAQGELFQGSIAGVNLQSAEYALLAESETSPLTLKIDGEADGKVDDAMALLSDSPVSAAVSALENWQTAGDVRAQLKLTIPFDAGHQPGIHVDAAIQNGQLVDPSETLFFDRLKTVLIYDSKTGLFAEDITGRLWGSPVSASLQTQDNLMTLRGKGRIETGGVAKHTNLPVQQVLSGGSQFQATLTVPLNEDADEQVPHLALKSSFQGVAIDLPEPFAKTASDKREGVFTIRFNSAGWRITGQLDELLFADFQLDEDRLYSGFIGINQQQRVGWHDENFLVQGQVDNFDVNEWSQVLDRFAQDGNGLEFPMPFIDLGINQFRLQAIELDDVSITGSRTQTIDQNTGNAETWRFAFTSDLADGQVGLPVDRELPIILDLSRLSLKTDKADTPAEAEGALELPQEAAVVEEKASLLAGVDPATLPYLDFSVHKLFVNERLYGSLSFKMVPEQGGVRLKQLQGEIGHIGIGSEQGETELYWLAGDQALTAFSGSLRTDNIADVLEFWEFPKMMDSKQSHIQAEVLWHDRPDQFSLNGLRGGMTFSAESGSFHSSPAAPADAAIRVVSLFNFANWVRRLRLDFSDIFSKGTSYDEIQGGVEFNEGKMRFEPAIEVKMPSGRMMLSGLADLNNEQLDASLAMTIPVSTNLPWIAALAGGLPAAAGVYLTSKLFEDEVDRFSSFSYSLKGPWAEPEVSVEKIFNGKPGK